MLEKLTTARARQHYYSIVTAALAVLVFYDIVSADSVPLWLGLVAAVFAVSATGTAAVVTRQQRRDGVLPD